jgi:hypothetical protein
MTLQGIVRNGTIVLDSDVTLPEGARVDVTVRDHAEEVAEKKPTLLGLLKLAGTLDDLPPDFAAEHDHYIHGTPKRNAKES